MRISDWSSDVCSSDLNNPCGFTTEFQADGPNKTATDFANLAPRRRGAGERDFINAWVGDKIGTELPTAVHPIEHASRNARFCSGSRDQLAVHDGARRGLEHPCTAARTQHPNHG